MILDIVLCVLLIVICFIGYKVGFLTTFIKLTSVLSGLVLAILFTSPVTNQVCKWGWDDGISNNIYENIISSDAFNAYFEAGGGEAGINDILIEVGIPSFLSGFIAEKLMSSVDPIEAAMTVSNGLSKMAMSVIIFFIILIFSSLLFWILKICVKGLRKAVGFIRVLDGIFGIIVYAIFYLLIIYILLLIASLVIQSTPSGNAFSAFMLEQLHLDDNNFGIAKYLYEHNLFGNIISLFI